MTTSVAAPDVLRTSERDEHHSIGYLKRATDLTVACALLAFTLPLMMMVALAIKFDSAGPVFYRQERVGLVGRRFAILKFRSMRRDAEADGRPVWAAADDDRITRVGQFIRCTRIDELPQLFNVLRGEMSIAGPRPERPYFVDQLSALIPSYHDRHTVLPGITGWAQINYPYGASIEDARQKLRYDLEYVANHRLLLDLKILVATVGVVVGRKGAR
jgi:exopolysaccharide biosynthesis polyprenyl glycosylphosphotransferase